MKKTLLSIASALAVMSLNAQCKNTGLDADFKGFLEDGAATHQSVPVIQGLETTYHGLYWWPKESAAQVNTGFKFSYVAQGAGNGLKYSVLQPLGQFQPFGVGFGSTLDGKEKTLDLSGNAVISFDITNISTAVVGGPDNDIYLKVALKDINNVIADTYGDGLVGTAYNFEIGARGLVEGEKQTFTYDFASKGVAKEAIYVNGTNTGYKTGFDLTKVVAVQFVLVSNTDNGKPSYQRWEIDSELLLENIKLGGCPALVGISKKSNVASFAVYPNPVSGTATFSEELTNVTVYDFTGNVVATEASASSLNTTDLQAGMYMISSDQGTTKIVVE